MGAAFVVLLAADGFYILKQRDLQEAFIEELVEPGSISPALIITAQQRESSFFERRDRVRVTFASSVLSDNPAEAPISLDFDVVAHFGPFGLTGDVFPLNDTPSSAKLLAALEGRHPRLSIRYGWSLFARKMSFILEASPFDMRLGTVSSGVGPMVWHFASSEPVRISAVFDENDVKTKFRAANLLAEITDPAGNVLSAKLAGAKADNHFDTIETATGGREWFLISNVGRADRVEIMAGDWRGGLLAAFSNASAEAHQETASSDAVLSGRYSFCAGEGELRLRVNREGVPDRLIKFESGEGEMVAENVPVALMRPVDDVELERIMRESGLMNLAVKRLVFTTDRGEAAELTAELTSGMRDGRTPTLAASLSTRLPESMMHLTETVIRGSRRAFRELRLADFMKAEKTKTGLYYSLDLKASLSEGIILNGTPLIGPLAAPAGDAAPMH